MFLVLHRGTSWRTVIWCFCLTRLIIKSLTKKLALQKKISRSLHVLVLKVAIKVVAFSKQHILIQEQTDQLNHFMILMNDEYL